MKRMIGLLFSLLIVINIACANIVTVSSAVRDSKSVGSGFLSEEVAEQFIKLFYKQEATIAESAKKILTGKEIGTEEQIKDIFKKCFEFYISLDTDLLEEMTSKATALAIKDISKLNKLVKGVVDICKNGKSFYDSDNAMQKTVDGLQIFSSLIDMLGYSSYLPIGFSALLTTTEFALCLGGYLETVYFQENATLYQYELEIAYWAGDELPYKEAPKIMIGSGITQEEADIIYLQLYLNYCVKRMLESVEVSSDDSDEDTTVQTEPIIEVTSVKFNQDSYTMFINSSGIFTINTYPSNANSGTGLKSLSSSDTSIITVDTESRTFASVAPGTAYVYATANNGTTGSCKITVLPYTATITNGEYTITEYIGSDSQVTIPSSVEGVAVTSIGNNAFEACKNITSITIPNSITSIGSNSFRDCTALKEIEIPNSVTSILTSAFYGCSNLSAVYIEDISSWCNINFEDWISNPVNYAKKLYLNGSLLTDITIPNNVTSINDYAFYRCQSLKSITIPNSVKNIGYDAFYWCFNLEAVYITDISSWCSINFESPLSNPVNNAKNLYLNGNLITNINIPNNITSICDYAFYYCQSLKSISIPNSVTSIGSSAFRECVNLEKITLPDNVKNIPDNAFYNCNNLTSVSIPNGVTSIGWHSFGSCESLKTMIIPSNVISIGDYAFSYCTGLSNITIPNKVTNIGDSAFRGCTGITEMTIPNSVTTIDGYAFAECANLSNITLPNSVTNLGGSAFAGTNITSITIPDSITSLPCDIVAGCTKLKNITLPDSVKSIDTGAFTNCTSLENITIPDSVTTMERSIFSGCTNLKEIIIPKGVTTIERFMFYKCTNLTSVTIPENVTTIDNYAFSECSNLKNIVIPDSVTTIGCSVFDSTADDFIIFGNLDCVANNYAKENSIKFAGFGDADGNAVLNVNDATSVQKHITRIELLSKSQSFVSNVNNDDKINIKDATLIQKKIAFGTEFGKPDNDTEDETEPPTEPSDSYTITFTDALSWGNNIYCYYWADNDTGMTTWPGEKMTYLRTNSYGQSQYTITVPANVEYIIFNNGSKQTVDIPFDGTKLRYYTTQANSNGKYGYSTW